MKCLSATLLLALTSPAFAEDPVLTREALDQFQPSPEQATRLERDRQALVSELMRCSMGVEVSLGAPAGGVGRFDRS